MDLGRVPFLQITNAVIIVPHPSKTTYPPPHSWTRFLPRPARVAGGGTMKYDRGQHYQKARRRGRAYNLLLETPFQSAAVANETLWESFEDEADPYVALHKCINASQEMIEKELNKRVEFKDTVRELTTTTVRLREERDALGLLLDQPENEVRRQLAQWGNELYQAEAELRQQQFLTVDLREDLEERTGDRGAAAIRADVVQWQRDRLEYERNTTERLREEKNQLCEILSRLEEKTRHRILY